MNIVEFADHLNLSIGTVSRALNDRPEVSAKTRRRVLEKAEELGFVRNGNARRLATGLNLMIRLECPYNTHILSDRYLVEMARAVEEAAGAYDYDLLLHLGTRRRDAATEIQAVDGLVIIATPETTADDLQTLTRSGRLPAVVIAGATPLDFPDASYVCLDTRPGVRQALDLLARLGHRRVGYVGSRDAGHLRGSLPGLLADAGLVWDPMLAVEAGTSQAEGRDAALHLLGLADPPTALFARTDVLASGAIQAAHSLGLSVPDDVSIIGHDNVEVAALVSPPLTTVAIDIPEVASAAVGALMAMISEKAPPSLQRLGTHLIVRRSCGPAPVRAASAPR